MTKTPIDCMEAELLLAVRASQALDEADEASLVGHISSCGCCLVIAHAVEREDRQTTSLDKPWSHQRVLAIGAGLVVAAAAVIFIVLWSSAPEKTATSESSADIDDVGSGEPAGARAQKAPAKKAKTAKKTAKKTDAKGSDKSQDSPRSKQRMTTEELKAHRVKLLEAAKAGSFREVFELCDKSLRLRDWRNMERCTLMACRGKNVTHAKRYARQMRVARREKMDQLCLAIGVSLD